MVNCTHCGAVLREFSKFCGQCGQPASIPSANKIFSAGLIESRSQDSFVENKPTNYLRESIGHTIFVVPVHFVQILNELLASLAAVPLAIVSAGDPDELLHKTRATIRNSGFADAQHLCILGGWSDVPPLQIPNTSIPDGDAFCLTDALYGSCNPFTDTDPFSALPEITVGRIPSLDPSVIRRLLLQRPELPRHQNVFQFGVTAQCWQGATARIIASLPNLPPDAPYLLDPGATDQLPESSILRSPSWDAHELNAVIGGGPKDAFRVLLFNVHGGPDEPIWVGEGGRGEYVRIFEPGTISNFNSALVVCEACYGGALGYQQQSVVEHFFENGGTSFIGSSTIAYGAPDSPLTAADLIAKHYVKGLYEGFSQGEALTKAKAEVLKDDPMNSEVAIKTVLSFNLFGLPWQGLYVREASTSAAFKSTDVPSEKASVLERVRAGLPSARTPKGNMLGSVRERYRSRLPARNQQFMIEQDQIAKTLREFRDFSKIDSMLNEMGASYTDCSLDFVRADDTEAYRLFSFTGKNSAKNALILLLDKTGQIKKTITSKGL